MRRECIKLLTVFVLIVLNLQPLPPSTGTPLLTWLQSSDEDLLMSFGFCLFPSCSHSGSGGGDEEGGGKLEAFSFPWVSASSSRLTNNYFPHLLGNTPQWSGSGMLPCLFLMSWSFTSRNRTSTSSWITSASWLTQQISKHRLPPTLALFAASPRRESTASGKQHCRFGSLELDAFKLQSALRCYLAVFLIVFSALPGSVPMGSILALFSLSMPLAPAVLCLSVPSFHLVYQKECDASILILFFCPLCPFLITVFSFSLLVSVSKISLFFFKTISFIIMFIICDSNANTYHT